MLIAAFLAAGIYTVFASIVAGKKHFFIGVSVLVVLGVLLFATGFNEVTASTSPFPCRVRL